MIEINKLLVVDSAHGIILNIIAIVAVIFTEYFIVIPASYL
ncbi:hypothetical protein [Staphylococcus durrellii]|nr:hypothetical protein [Staphylococcus durrellii]